MLRTEYEDPVETVHDLLEEDMSLGTIFRIHLV